MNAKLYFQVALVFTLLALTGASGLKSHMQKQIRNNNNSQVSSEAEAQVMNA